MILEALLILRNKTGLVESEKPLNRALRLSFRAANRKLGLEYFPSLDAENSTDDIELEGSKPDLSWSFHNDLADDDEDCERSFALECKRLGKPTPSGWKLNEQYVKAGLLRFFQEEKGYSRGGGLGAMVGYIQNMDYDEILKEINSHIVSANVPIPALAIPPSGWQYQGVSQMNHCFVRSFPLPIIFLDHFWVDLRDHYHSSVQGVPARTPHNVASEEPSVIVIPQHPDDKQSSIIQQLGTSDAQLELPFDQNR